MTSYPALGGTLPGVRAQRAACSPPLDPAGAAQAQAVPKLLPGSPSLTGRFVWNGEDTTSCVQEVSDCSQGL